MARPAVIFVGPSRPRELHRAPWLELRGPAARGDLLAAAREGVPVIGLIDGVFHQSLAVTPREVRDAAAAGATLLGGASMGALRAVDCPGVMRGVGEIYEAFARGELTDDDEVAVTFDPIDHRVIAYPLVHVREVARRLAEQRPDAQHALARFVERVRALPFVDRTRARLRAIVENGAQRELAWADIERWLDHASTDVKARDAARVIAAVEAAWRQA